MYSGTIAYPMMLCVCLCVSDVTVLWSSVLTPIALFPLYFFGLNIGGSTVIQNIELHSERLLTLVTNSSNITVSTLCS